MTAASTLPVPPPPALPPPAPPPPRYHRPRHHRLATTAGVATSTAAARITFHTFETTGPYRDNLRRFSNLFRGDRVKSMRGDGNDSKLRSSSRVYVLAVPASGEPVSDRNLIGTHNRFDFQITAPV